MDIARRAFLGRLLKASIAVPGAALAYYGTGKDTIGSLNEVFGDVRETLGPQRLPNKAQVILDQLTRAKSGQLMAFYQIFNPFEVLDKESILSFVQVSSDNLLNAAYRDVRHRVRALPAIASIHALATLADKDREVAANVISAVQRSGLDYDPHRELLEIIWQTALSALIRNKHNWNTIIFDEKFLRDGANICRKYLDGDMVLFSPALIAFHAMLTYYHALNSRGQTQEKLFVGSIIENIRLSGNQWFELLLKIMKGRETLDDMLPQLSEILMGYNRFPELVSRFVILSRLYLLYILHLIAIGSLSSEFTTIDRAVTAEKVVMSFLVDYKITPNLWNQLRHNSDRLLGTDAVKYFDALFNTYPKAVMRLGSHYREGEAAEELARLIPFRSHEEDILFERSFGSLDLESIAKLILDTGLSSAGLRSIAAPIANLQAKQFGHYDQLQPDLIYHKLGRRIQKELDRPAQLLDQHRDEIKWLTQTTSGAALRGSEGSRAEVSWQQEQTMQTPASKQTILRGRPSQSTKAQLYCKLRPLQIKLSQEDIDLLEELREKTRVHSWVQVIRDALQLYARALKTDHRRKG